MPFLARILPAGGFAAIAIGSTLPIVAADAQGTASGTLQLKGDVVLACSVTVTDLGQSLNLAGGESAKAVGNVVETCNSGTGYQVTLSSANAGQLRSGASNAVAYSVLYDGQSGNLNSSLPITRSSAQFGRQSTLAVTVPASGQSVAGSYSDTLTVTITAK